MNHFLSFPKATNALFFEIQNTQVAAIHSTPILDDHSMPATLPIPPIPKKSHPICTRYKPDITPHNSTSPLYSFDRTRVTTYPQHGLQTKRGRPVKPLERLRDFV